MFLLSVVSLFVKRERERERERERVTREWENDKE